MRRTVALVAGAAAALVVLGVTGDRAPDGWRLVDVASEVGLDERHGAFRWDVSMDPPAMMGGGLCWLDADRDGWLDLFVTSTWAERAPGRWQSEEGGLPTTALWRNREGRFRAAGPEAGAEHAVRGAGCVAADLDRDGWTDLYVTSDRYNLLLWNDGDGTFTEGAEAAGVDAYGWQTGAAVGDLDGDGWQDLVVAGYVDLQRPREGATLGFPNTHAGERDLVLLSNGPGPGGRPTFREVGAAVGVEAVADDDLEYGLGVVLSDVDLDGDLDLYVANDTNPNRLYLHEPAPTAPGFRFVDVSAAAGVDDRDSGMGVAVGDHDGDGLADLFVTNFGRQLHAAFRNLGGARFDAMIDAMGPDGIGVGVTGWGVSWADLDLDTDLDLLAVHGNVPVTDLAGDAEPVELLAQVAPGTFVRSDAVAGVRPLNARGSAVADHDNDGDLDVAVSSVGGDLVLLDNRGADGHWLVVDPQPAVPGTVVTVTLPDGRRLRREVLAGSSYLSSEDPRCHFGLGATTAAVHVEVRWPDGRHRSLTTPPDHHLPVTPP